MANILMVDDEPNILKLSSFVVKSLGYTVQTAENGRLAKDFLDTNPDIDLVISDMIMPEMNGVELCQAVHHKYPVIIVSAMADEFSVAKIFDYGTLDFIAKPFDIAKVKERLAVIMHKLGLASDYVPAVVANLGDVDFCKGENVLVVAKNPDDLQCGEHTVLEYDSDSFSLEGFIKDSDAIGHTIYNELGGIRIFKNLDLLTNATAIEAINRTNLILGDLTGIYFVDEVPSEEITKLFDRVVR